MQKKEENGKTSISRILTNKAIVLCGNVLDSTPSSALLYQILIVVETLQIVSFAYNDNLDLFWSSKEIKASAKVLYVFQLEQALRNSSNGSDRKIVILVILGFLVATVVLMLVSLCQKGVQNRKNKEENREEKLRKISIWTRLCALNLYLMRTILAFPMLQALFSGFYCSTSGRISSQKIFRGCLRNDQIWFLIATVFSLVLLITLLVFNSMFLIDLNPRSKIPFSGFYSKIWTLELSTKVLVSFLSVFNLSGQDRENYLLAISILLGIQLAWKMHSNPFYNRSVDKVSLICKSVTLYIFLAVGSRELLRRALSIKKDEVFSFLILDLGLIPITFFTLIQNRQKEEKILLKDIKKLKSAEEAQLLIHTLERLIRRRDVIENFIKFHGFLRMHSKDFLEFQATLTKQTDQNPDTARAVQQGSPSSNQVILLRSRKRKKTAANNWFSLAKCKPSSSSSNLENNNDGGGLGTAAMDYIEIDEKKNKKYNSFMEFTLERAILKFPKNSFLRIWLALLLHDSMKLMWRPIYLLTQVSNSGCSFSERLVVERALTRIESTLEAQNKSIKIDEEVDVVKLVKFKAAYQQFLLQMNQTVELNLTYWLELSNELPDSRKLVTVGQKIAESSQALKSKFNVLKELEHKKHEIYQVYAAFLINVVHERVDDNEIISVASLLNRSNYSTLHTFENTEEERKRKAGLVDNDALVMEVSASEDSLGTILGVGSSIWLYLGFRPADLVGKQVEELMPQFFQEKHEQFLVDFFYSKRKKMLKRKRELLVRARDGFLVNCDLEVKIYPCLKNGMRMVGIFNQFQQQVINRDLIKKGPQQSEKYRGFKFRSLLMNGTWKSINDGMTRNLEGGFVSEHDIVHYAQVNATTGEVLGVSESCQEALGLMAWFFKSRSEVKLPNLNQICPDILDPENFRFLKSNKGFECKFDTTVLNTDEFLINNHREMSGRGPNPKSSEIQTKYGISAFELEQRNQLENFSSFRSSKRHYEADSEPEIFEELSLDKKDHKFKEAWIRAWFDSEDYYDKQRVVTLKFVLEEKATRSGDSSDFNDHHYCVEEVLGSDEGGVGMKTSLKMSSHEKTITDIEEESFDKMRISKEMEAEISRKRSTTIRRLTNLSVVASFLSPLLWFTSYYFEDVLVNDFKPQAEFHQSLFHRASAIQDLRYYSRKLELIASGMIGTPGNTQALLFHQTQNKVKRLSDDLLTAQKSASSIWYSMKQTLSGKMTKKEYPFLHVLKNSEEATINSNYEEGVYQYLFSVSFIITAKPSDLDRRIISKTEVNSLKITANQLSTIVHNSVNSLEQGFDHILQDFKYFYTAKVDRLRAIIVFPFYAVLVLIWVLSSIHCCFYAKILDNDADVVRLFSMVQYNEIVDLIVDIEVFQEEYLDWFCHSEGIFVEERFEDDELEGLYEEDVKPSSRRDHPHLLEEEDPDDVKDDDQRLESESIRQVPDELGGFLIRKTSKFSQYSNQKSQAFSDADAADQQPGGSPRRVGGFTRMANLSPVRNQNIHIQDGMVLSPSHSHHSGKSQRGERRGTAMPRGSPRLLAVKATFHNTTNKFALKSKKSEVSDRSKKSMRSIKSRRSAAILSSNKQIRKAINPLKKWSRKAKKTLKRNMTKRKLLQRKQSSSFVKLSHEEKRKEMQNMLNLTPLNRHRRSSRLIQSRALVNTIKLKSQYNRSKSLEREDQKKERKNENLKNGKENQASEQSALGADLTMQPIKDFEEEAEETAQFMKERRERMMEKVKGIAGRDNFVTLAFGAFWTSLITVIVHYMKITITERDLYLSEKLHLLGITPLDMGRTFNWMYDSLAENRYPIMMQGSDAYGKARENGFTSLRDLTTNDDLSSALGKYKVLLDEALYVNVCETSLRQKLSLPCDKEIYKSGLETMAVSVLQDSKKVLYLYQSGDQSEELIKDLLNSADLTQMEETMITLKKSFNYLLTEYIEETVLVVSRYEIYGDVIMSLIFLTFVFATFHGIFVIGPELHKKVEKSREILKLIPFEILTKNDEIREYLMRGNEDKDKKRRMANYAHLYKM